MRDPVGRSTALAAYALAAVLLPLVQLVGHRSGGWTWAPPVAVLLAAGLAARVKALARVSAFGWLGGVMVLAAAWLIPQSTPGPATLALGAVIGLALGLALPAPHVFCKRGAARFAVLGLVQLIVLTLVARDDALPSGCLYATALLLLGVVERRRTPSPRPRLRAGAAGAALLTLLTTGWVGANSLTATWFGALVNHGPRGGHQVALTFDDGPDVRFTLAIRDVLDRYGVKGTFFTVGKALDARPDISRALLSDGHLLANHSYLHDALGWLSPSYSELDRTQRTFKRRLDVCPTFFRPPHGQHTPFMALAAARHRMTMVGWDDSGRDWATRDPGQVARTILGRVHPGSIILLHDGLDGNLDADRSVVVGALPSILTGLRARHLQPVRLDQLLGRPGYRGRC